MSVEKTLEERGGRYGNFEHHAKIAQDLQDVMRAEPGWGLLKADQRQALTVIADKIARMLNGDAGYRDNWHDIVGYAKLVDDRMLQEQNEFPEPEGVALGGLPEGFTLANHGCPPPPFPGKSRMIELLMVTGEIVQTTWDDAFHNEDWKEITAFRSSNAEVPG